MIRLTLPLTFAAALVVFAEPSFAGKIFVSNEKDNTITVLDTDTLETVR